MGSSIVPTMCEITKTMFIAAKVYEQKMWKEEDKTEHNQKQIFDQLKSRRRAAWRS